MYNRKVYDPEFKLNVVKEYLNGDKSQAQICEEYTISPSMFFKWLKKYKESGYDDSVFNVKKERPESIISDYSKITPFIFESAGIRKVQRDKFEHILHNKTNILFERMDKEKNQEKMQRILNEINRRNDK